MAKQKKAKLKWSLQEYMPAFSTAKPEAELRKEYSRLRKIAQKRLAHFVGTEWENTQVFKKNYGKYPVLADIKTQAQLRKQLASLARYINASTSTVTGLQRQRRLTIEALKDKGYNFVTKANFHEFTDFMDSFRNRNLERIYDSEAALTVFNAAERFKIPEEELKRDFEEFLELREEIENMKIPRNPKERNSDYFREKLGLK